LLIVVFVAAVAGILLAIAFLDFIVPEFTARQLLALRLRIMGFADKRLSIRGINIAYW